MISLTMLMPLTTRVIRSSEMHVEIRACVAFTAPFAAYTGRAVVELVVVESRLRIPRSLHETALEALREALLGSPPGESRLLSEDLARRGWLALRNEAGDIVERIGKPDPLPRWHRVHQCLQETRELFDVLAPFVEGGSFMRWYRQGEE